jgi:hypothetical protein
MPPGLEIDKCYGIINHTDEHGTQLGEYDLLDEEQRVIARNVPLSCL